MSNFTSKQDAVSFIKEIRLNNLHDWQFSQKLLEIENIIDEWYETEDYSICEDCSHSDKEYDEDDLEEKYEDGKADGHKDGKEEVINAIRELLNDLK